MSKPIALVTGGAGHVGSHVIEQLVAEGKYRVISLDDYSNGSPDNHIGGVAAADYRRGHTRNIEALIPETPELVFHLGEYARVAPSFDDVRQVFDSNQNGTFAVVEFARTRSVRKLVYAASSTRFAIEGDGRFQNPYSFTKAANVELITSYGRWYQLPHAICYFYNAYGPRERGEGKSATLIAKFERLQREGKPLTVVKPGTQRRQFTYVGDLARGVILTAEKGAGDGYALGAGKSYSVLDIAKAFGGPIEMVEGYPGRMDAENDATKIRALGWKPTMDVLDYVERIRKG